MLGKIIKRWFSGFAAAVLTVSNIAPAVPTRAEDTPELCYQNIELYPNGEDAEQVVTLDGLMPEGAEAEAVDVSDEHEGIAAYDITITDGWREYQPGEEHPIWVEITDPVITENIQLWHIHDDGEREQIFDFTAEEGKVSFYATGFSVYQIVEKEFGNGYTYPASGKTFTYIDLSQYGWKKVDGDHLDILTTGTYSTDGFLINYISIGEDGIFGNDRFVKNTVEPKVKDNKRTGLSVTDNFLDNAQKDLNNSNADVDYILQQAVSGGAAHMMFEKDTNDHYYIYCYSDEENKTETNKQYAKALINYDGTAKRYSMTYTNSKADASHFTLEPLEGIASVDDDPTKIMLREEANTYENNLYWSPTVGTHKENNKIVIDNIGITSYYKYNSSNPKTDRKFFNIWYYDAPPVSTDPYNLDEKSYAFAGSSNSKLYAMQSETNSTVLVAQQITYDADAHSFFSSNMLSGWTFHWQEGTLTYKITNSYGKYLKLNGGLSFVDNEADATAFTVTAGTGANANKIKLSANGKAIKCTSNGFKADTNNDDADRYIDLVSLTYSSENTDPLDGFTYGLMRYVSGATGHALMAASNNAMELLAYVIRQEAEKPETVYVAEDADITEWTFEKNPEGRYYIYADFLGTRKYLQITNDNIVFRTVQTGETLPSGLDIQVVPGNDNKVKLVSNGRSLKLKILTDDAGNGRPVFYNVASSEGEYFNLVDLTELPEHNRVVTYKAREVSVSDVKNGEEIIVYTRVWNETDQNNKHYDFYALAHDGTLIPCYERGDSIMWLSGKRNTLIWNFTEYYFDYTNTPNYYYELYNPYSQKYVAPIRPNASLLDGQVLSNEKIGINLPGRKNGDFYTDILAWDDVSYSYSGLGVTADSKHVEPTTRHLADTFYFARLVDLKNDLTEVETVNNNDYGITMKMIDFDDIDKDVAQQYVDAAAVGLLDTPDTTITTYGNATRSRFTWEYLGGVYKKGTDYEPTKGLLSTKLGDDGYPLSNVEKYSNVKDSNIPNKKYNQTIAPAFANAETVNHLFIQSILEQSGYFEFDSSQNYATLKNHDGNFFVSKELGTHDKRDTNSLRHGQFFPYDDIDMDTYAKTNGENKYKATGEELPEDDPRKYEKLHLIEDPDYYFGMELAASFTQTPDGKDNWGHDIIFEFTGDDDFWLYVDGELVIDLGGTHSALAGDVNFATGDVVVNGQKTNLRDVFKQNYITRNPDATPEQINSFLAGYFDWDSEKNEYEKVFKDYTKHNMKIFYMERGASASNLHMRFNLSYVKPGDVILTKEISGTDDLDFEMVEYPFQIYYKFANGAEHILGDETDETQDAAVFITYENSTKTVEHLQTYKAPGSMSAATYTSVFFINPKNKAVIHFPTNTYQYKIVECGMDEDIYNWATINNVQLAISSAGSSSSDTAPSVRQNGDRYDYDSGWMTVETQGFATYNNHVNPEGLRKLRFTKELYDNEYTYGTNLSSEYKNAHKLTAEQDPTTFTFRLYLSNGVSDELPLAYMVNYRVLDPENYYCTWDSIHQEFVRYVYNGDYIKLDALDTLLDSFSLKEARDAFLRKMTFECSMNGSISKIPAWYTVEVPNLPVGLTFMVEERDSTTERPLGYERVIYEREAGTYNLLESGVENKGRIEKDKSPMLRVINQRGYELQAIKDWSDKDFVAGHDDIFMALYVKNDSGGYDLDSHYITSPVRRLSSPNTEARFFMKTLGDKSFSDFAIFEVKVSGEYTVDEKGFVTLGLGASVDRIKQGDMTLVLPSADRITAADSAATVFQNVEFLDTDNASDWSVQKQFDTQSNLYGDRVIKAGTVPDYLLGAEYLRTADDSKSNTSNLCTFNAGTDADIYVAWDSRSGTKPSWLNSWTELPDTIQTATTSPVPMKLFKKTFTQGTPVTLGSNFDGTAPTGSYHNYFVLAVPKYSEGRIIANLLPSNDGWTIQKAFDSSSFPYNDREVRVDDEGFPGKFTGAEYVRTIASAGEHTFKVQTNSVVYVAWDSAVTPPSWLQSGWTKTNDTIKTSNKRTMVLYSKDCSENDNILLGGNNVSDSVNPYFVLALPKYTYETEYNTGNETNAMVILQGTANVGDITGLYCRGDDNQYHLAPASEYPVRTQQSEKIEYYLHSNAVSVDNYAIYKLNLSGYKFRVDQNGTVTGIEGDIAQGTELQTSHSSKDSENNVIITATYDWSSVGENGVFAALYQNTNGTWQLVSDTVKRLSSPISKVSYTVSIPTDLPEGMSIDQYLEEHFKVCTVTLAGNGYLIDKDGYMTQISSSGSAEESFTEDQITTIEQITATPVTYTTRKDTVSNTRNGGIEIDLYQMGTRNVPPDTHKGGTPGTALPGGVFELYHGDELVGTYVSNENGRITVLYSFVQGDYYTLKQTSAPQSYIGLPEPVIFTVQGDTGSNANVQIYRKTNSETPVYEPVIDSWRDYHLPLSDGDRLVAYIDVYNKPFILQAIKVDNKEVDNEGNPKPIQGVKFALYHGVNSLGGMTPGQIVNPVETYGNLITDANGVIPNISQGLEQGVYFLKEVSAKSGYKLLDRYIPIYVKENDVDIRNGQDDPSAYETVDPTGHVTTITLNSGIKLIKTDDNNSRTCEIMIPNEKAQSDYYFDIEKIIFADKNIHDSNAEQKFVFKVEHLLNDTVDECFYVTLNCSDFVNAYPYTNNLAQFNGHLFTPTDSRYDPPAPSVTVNYGSGESYTYPAAIFSGTQRVKVAKKGTYRVTEQTNWSCTDYDFWKGSQLFISSDTGRTGTYSSESEKNPYVEFEVTDADADKTQCPKVSFTNAETEFAYLSSQAYAENTIK